MKQPLHQFLLFGADYNPEQWPEEVWIEDMRLMKEAGVNVVSIAIFSWAKLQSAPGVFHFEWLDRLMDLLAENGIMASLATATASPPAWLVRAHPEILPTLADGSRMWPGSRQHYNPASKAYRDATAELVTALAHRYNGHPALAIWHVNNEYGCHTSADYGDETADAFRSWLGKRYGSLDALNAAWGTAFWSQHYHDWNEIFPPRQTPTFGNPTQSLDFQRFSSDMLLECYLTEARILRDITPDIPLTTNFMDWFKPVDYAKWAPHLDFTCVDTYPEPVAGTTGMALAADQTRSWKPAEPWMVMEQVTTHVNWRERNATKPPGMMRLLSYQAIARGSNGICYFQWRQSKAGAEKFHGAMVGHGDPAKQRCFQESKTLGNELARLGEIASSRVDSEVGVLFDHENWWALETDSKPSHALKYDRELRKFHNALHRANISADFVFTDTDFSKFKILLVPCLYLFKPGVAEQLIRFVDGGGQLVVTYFSGIVDRDEHILTGGYPAPLRELLGITVHEWRIPADDTPFPVSFESTSGFQATCQASFWSEVVEPDTAETLAVFTGGDSVGHPAVTRRKHGSGRAWYLATSFGDDFHDDLLRQLAADAGITPPLAAPDGVEVGERIGPDHQYLFLLNHSNEEREIDLAGHSGHELLSETDVSSVIRLEPFGVRVIRR